MSTKLSKGRYSPAFFDTAQDIIGGLPLELVEQWLGSAQEHQDALRLLEPYKVKGYSEFYAISGGLYGPEADAIEEIAEDDTECGEIAISQAICERLPEGHAFTIVEKSDEPTATGPMFRLVDGPRLAGVEPSKARYPIPYSGAFHDELVAYEARVDDVAFGKRLAEEHTQNKVVVLIERDSIAAETHEVAMFSNLSLSAFMKNTGMVHLPSHNAAEIKVAGPLGIYTFDEPAAALRFAREFRAHLAREGVSCRIGIDAGPVLVFDLSTGSKDIAGNPVNIASKMAQDRGKQGKLYLSERMKDRVDVSGFQEIRYTVSGVDLSAYEG